MLANTAGLSDSFFQALPIPWIQNIGNGWAEERRSRKWEQVEAKGRLYHTMEQKISHCV